MRDNRESRRSALVAQWRHLGRLWARYERTHDPVDYGEVKRAHRRMEYDVITYAKLYYHGKPDGVGRDLALGEIVLAARQMTLAIV